MTKPRKAVSKNMSKKNRILLLAAIFLGIIVLVVLSWAKFKDDNHIAAVNGEKISVEEYKVYLNLQIKRFENLGGQDIWETSFDGKTAESLAKQYALDDIAHLRWALEETKRLGIILSDEEIAACSSFTEEILQDSQWSLFIEDHNISKKLIQKVNEDYELYMVFFEVLTENFEPSMNEFRKYFQEYIAENDLEPDESELQRLEEELMEKYIAEKKQAIFSQEYDKWLRNAEVTQNQKVWEAIHIDGGTIR